MVIEFINGKWTVTSADGTILGRFDTREEAMKATGQTGGAGMPKPQGQGLGMAPQGQRQPQMPQQQGGLGVAPQQQQQGGGMDIIGLLQALLGGSR